MPSGTPLPANALSGAANNATAAQPKKRPYFIVQISLLCEPGTQGIQTRPQRGAIEELLN
jgi:hypothetical protein